MTAIERSYIAQGWKVPKGLTTDQIAVARAKYEIDEIFVPVATATGVVAWGVPFVDGKPLKH